MSYMHPLNDVDRVDDFIVSVSFDETAEYSPSQMEAIFEALVESNPGLVCRSVRLHQPESWSE